jgi:hypothetical protein
LVGLVHWLNRSNPYTTKETLPLKANNIPRMYGPWREDGCQQAYHTVVMLDCRPKYSSVLRQALLRQSRHHTARTEARDRQPNLRPYRQSTPLPVILQKNRA